MPPSSTGVFFQAQWLKWLSVDALDVAALELLELLVEGDDLRGTHEGEIQRIEEQDDVLAAVVRELEIILEAVVRHHGGRGEVGRLGRDQRHGDEVEVEVLHSFCSFSGVLARSPALAGLPRLTVRVPLGTLGQCIG